MRQGFTIVEVLICLLIALVVAMVALAGVPAVLKASENVRRNAAIMNVLDSLVSIARMAQISNVSDLSGDESIQEAIRILEGRADGFDLDVGIREENLNDPLFQSVHLVTIVATMVFQKGDDEIIRLRVVRRAE